MPEFLHEILSFPTVVFTVLLGIAAVYWLLVIVGALGLDMLDADHGGHDVAPGGHDIGDGGHDVGHDHAGHAHDAEPGFIGWLLGPLKLNSVPSTLVVSLIAFFGWLISHFAGHYLAASHSSRLTEVGLLIAAFVLGVLFTAIVVRPLAPIFRTNPGAHRIALVGKVVMIDTSRVDATFGMAKAEDGGPGLLVQVRCDQPNELGRGHRALVVSYDEAREVYEVASLGDILPDRSQTSGTT
jgi:hypothetical protein